MTLDVLAIGPHPDDVELACGGTLISMVDRGYRVGAVDLTDALLSTRGTPENRKMESEKAKDIMGLVARYRLGLLEGELRPSKDNIVPIVNIIRRTQAHIILLPFWDDRHPDHSDASKLIYAACYWAGVAKYGVDNWAAEEILPPHRPHRVLYYFLHWEGEVSFVVDISSSFDRKLQAIRAYYSQFFARPSEEPTTFISRPEFLEGVINRARYYGSKIGVEYGEPFHCKEVLRVDDIIAWTNSQGVVG